MKSKRRHPVAPCPRCGHRRRVVQCDDDQRWYKVLPHMKPAVRGGVRCKGGDERVAVTRVLF